VHSPGAYEWSDKNEAVHVVKQGVRFSVAALVFSDARRMTKPDTRRDYGEERFNVVGMADGVCINVTYVMKGDTAVIISARRASRKERKAYG
jgi:uncharacterized DUF497 family protein